MGGKYQAYPEYKDSGVEWLGDVPKHWGITRIKYVSELTPKKPLVQRDLQCSFVPMEKLKTDSIVLDETRVIDDVYDGYTYFEDSDVLMAKVTPCFENKNIAVAKGLVNGIGFGSSEIYVIRANNKTSNRFLYYRLQEDSFMEIATAAMTGAGGLRRVPSEVVNNYVASLPAIDEQETIANFLDHETAKIDTLIEKQQQLIKLLKEKRQAVISHAVTKGLNSDAPMRDSGIEWLGEVPEHWRVKKFSHCASIRNGQVDPTKFPYSQYILIAPNHIESGTGRLLLMETAEEQAADSGKYSCKKGEVIYSKIRPALAKACLSPSDQTICSADMYPVQGMNGLTNNFLLWTLLSGWFTSLVILESDRVAMPKINREKLADVRLPIPPMNEQQKICSEVRENISVIDTLLGKADKSIKLSRERRTALISAAVTGKIDVRGWQVPQQGNKEDAA